jgi:hypothetical protein
MNLILTMRGFFILRFIFSDTTKVFNLKKYFIDHYQYKPKTFLKIRLFVGAMSVALSIQSSRMWC